MHTVHLTATLSGEFSLVGVCWVVSSGCAFSSTIKKKKLELFFSFLFMERTEGGCAVEEVCGEEAERWSMAENIRNWRKARNGGFSWLPNSCNFHTTAWFLGTRHREWGRGM